jgi:hypothetical protein
MSEDNTWNPASGCFQCPINIDLGQSWADINPLPCFPDIGRGYFSVPLNAPYTPIPSSESDLFGSEKGYSGGDSEILEINSALVGKFFAIFIHEKWHILMSLFSVKGVIHHASCIAHLFLFDIISGGSSKEWEKLRQWNLKIAKITQGIEFIEELTATLLGCAEFRKLKPELQHQVESDRIEQEFVRNHSKLFGPDFEKIYGQLDKIYRKFGEEPIRILTNYSMDWLEVGMRIPDQKSYAETTKARLYKCLEIINSIRNLPDTRNWTRDDWDQFFDRWLLDFRRWREGRQELNQCLINHLHKCQKWWEDQGVDHLDNPALAAELILRTPYELNMLSTDCVLSIEKLAPIYATDTRYQQKTRRINERVMKANAQNRSVVAFETRRNSTGIIFVPLFNKDNQGAIPFALVMIGEKTWFKNIRMPPHITENDPFVHDLAIRGSLSALLFFEGLRLMATTGCGVRCPIRSMEWAARADARKEGNKLPTCCGRNKEIIAFWEAGNKAKNMGLFSPHKWDRPHECM